MAPDMHGVVGDKGGPMRSSHPAVSIVIAARNEGQRIAQCLEALQNQSLDRGQYEVIVVDDDSNDGTADVAACLGARVVRQQYKGAAAARNRGIEEARGEIVLFTDADCIPEMHWVERLSSPLKQTAIAGTVGRIVSLQSHWIAGLIQVELDEHYERMGHRESIDYVNTGNCGFKRALLCQNHFDETFLWIEDLELSFRLAQRGERVVFVQDALVEHAHPERLLAHLRRKFCHATFVPYIYRRYPNKILCDSRTSANRRLQLLLLVLALASAPAGILSVNGVIFSLGCLGGAMALSLPVYRRAAAKSLALGLVAPFFVLMGNLAFAVGMAWALIARTRFRSPHLRA